MVVLFLLLFPRLYQISFLFATQPYLQPGT